MNATRPAENRSQDAQRAFFRPREITERYGATKAWIHARIREGRLEARKVDGCTFISARSVRRLFGETE